MKLNVLVDTVSTYLTLFSALMLPVVLLGWGRSYLVSERFYRAEEGLAVVAGLSNGELSVWAAPTDPAFVTREHRSRETSWGWSNRRTFQRVSGDDHVWLLGFGYARADGMPWRNLPLTGRSTAVVVPIWFVALIVGALPLRLLARNMPSSKEFLAQRAAENASA